ncbi:M56 family metallopeptidase [Dactylosporangium sp. NPDC048998]|uniref:M56 family metallopeptidase n=1 Tax=Dactylosporangium sp. NPDC048998 TaxID=3363976 RepID=UPI0037139776
MLIAAYAAGLVLAAGPRLARARWVARAPGLGIFAWQMWCVAVLASAVLTGVTATLHWDRTHGVVCRAWRVCLDALLGAHGPAAQLTACGGAALLVLLAGRLVTAGWRLASADRRQRRRLRGLLQQTGRRLPGIGVVVVPAEHPDAYLLPGGGEQDVVVTSAAVSRLTAEQLQAVTAHERAHATGRHYRLLRTVQLLHRAFPRLSCFGTALRQVQRLVELRADDVAARSSAPIALAGALVALAEARAEHAAAGPGSRGDGPLAAPDGPPLLAAHGGDTTERLHRLLQPRRPLPAGLSRMVAAGFALAPVLPVVIAAVEHTLPS